jgi:hypothetical protein
MAKTEDYRKKGLYSLYSPNRAHFSLRIEKEAKIMSKHGKNQENGSVAQTAPVLSGDVEIMPENGSVSENTPELPAIPQITGIKTAIYQIEAVIARVHKSAAELQTFDQKIDEKIAKMKTKAAEDSDFGLLLSMQPDWENNIKKGSEIKKKGVSEDLGFLVQNLSTILDLARDLERNYGLRTETVKDSDLGRVKAFKSEKEAKPNINQAVLDAISPEFKSKFNLRAERIEMTEFFRVYGTGHEKGTIYKSNLNNW